MSQAEYDLMQDNAPARAIVSLVAATGADLVRGVTKAIYISVAGNMRVISEDGTDSGVFAVQAGELHPLRIRQLHGDTTATVMGYY